MILSGLSLLIAAGGAQAPAQAADALSLGQALSDAAPAVGRCKGKDPADIVVCGRPGERYRIDPNVLEASRAAEAQMIQPSVSADGLSSDCVGPQHCGGGVIPLVGMALTAVRAAAMAAEGDDWREAFRTRPDEYRAYQATKAKEREGARVSLRTGVSK